MKKKNLFAALALMAAVSLPALADEYGKHPFYLHALSDLRTAAWQVDHRRPEDGQVSQDELVVHDEIRAAIGDLQRAAWLDGKPIEWREPTDVWLPREGRLHAAIDLLRKVRSDVAREEDDPRSRPFQQRGLAHVDVALDAAQHAVGDVRRHDMRRE
ncbi:hypothetical protein J2W23_000567 [Variovorax boronicumulans]|uniref:hypothetical protein n=1 Tax=Variovorax boronicumulans TaxID=436515 RepID=UPI00159E35B4|nr:hypothetical protein [Variovorax boronicumulans]MDQ0012203.1 hypothetical protein [Variovorax boronicumulans]